LTALEKNGKLSAIRAYLKTVNTPKQRMFPPAGHHFFLQYPKNSRKKTASSGEKPLAVGHISGFQIDPGKGFSL